MSGYNYDDPDEFTGSGSGMRKQLEDLLAENKKLREAIEGDKRQATVSALLEQKGLDPAVSELIPSDADPAKWLDEKGHLLGAKPKEEPKEEQPGTNPEVHAQTPESEDPAVIAEREARAAMEEAQASGQSVTVKNNLLEQLDKFEGSVEDLEKFFAANGADPSLS